MRALLIHDGDTVFDSLVEPVKRGLMDVELEHWDPSLQGAPTRGLDWLYYDIVLLDAEPAGADGIEWLELWKKGAWMMPPVVLLGVEDDAEHRERALAAGAAAYVPKASLTAVSIDNAVRRAIATSLTLPMSLSQGLAHDVVDVEAIGEPIGRHDPAAIAGYRVHRRLAAGGMANVYLASREADGRRVVLKILDARLASQSTFRQRFMREHEILKRIAHRNVCAIYDEQVSETGGYIAMEYLAGGSLKQRIRRGLALEAVPGIIGQIAAGLGAVHEAGVVHRDLKPQNIMFRDNDELAIVDFGLAREVDATSTLTQKGMVFATPLYMSPEQCLGLPHDARGDLYSLGTIVYEMITGQPPFSGANAPDLAYQHVHIDPPILPGVARGFQPLVSRLLAKRPEERFRSAAEVLRALP